MFTTSFTHTLTSRLTIPAALLNQATNHGSGSSNTTTPTSKTDLISLGHKTALSILQDYEGLIRLSPVVISVENVPSSHEKAVDTPNIVEEFHPSSSPSTPSANSNPYHLQANTLTSTSHSTAAQPPTPTVEAGNRPDQLQSHHHHTSSTISTDSTLHLLSTLPPPTVITEWAHLETIDDLPLLELPTWLFNGWKWRKQLTYYQCVRNLVDGIEAYTDPGSGVKTWGIWRVGVESIASADSHIYNSDDRGAIGGGATNDMTILLMEQQVVHCPVWLSWYIKMTMRKAHEGLHRAIGEKWERIVCRQLGRTDLLQNTEGTAVNKRWHGEI